VILYNDENSAYTILINLNWCNQLAKHFACLALAKKPKTHTKFSVSLREAIMIMMNVYNKQTVYKSLD